jgi:hypothetical protein
MADSIYTFDPTAASNTALDSIAYGPNQLYHSNIDNLFRAFAAKLAQHVDDLGGVNTVGGTANALTATIASGITAYATGQLFWFKNTPGPNTTAATMNVNSIGDKEIRLQGDSALEGGEMLDNGYYGLLYDAAYDGAAGGWILLNPATSSVDAATTTAAGIVPLNYFGIAQNIGFAASVGSSALTVALKGADGNDPSASNPVIIPFRNVTAATGTPTFLTVTAATSIVISSGSTMGFTSAVIGKLWIVGFNDGGTFRLGLVNCLSGTSVRALADGIYSSTAEGGAGGADTAQTIYTGTAVTDKAMTVLGYLEATEATAGTWATAPSLLQLRTPSMPLPGAVIQSLVTTSSAVATGTTQIPADDTIPQITEGDEYLTRAITPSSGANVLNITSRLASLVSSGAIGNAMAMALFRDSTADAIVADALITTSTGGGLALQLTTRVKAASTTSTTFRARAGLGAAGTTTLNGVAGVRRYGGVSNSFIQVDEIVA